MVKIIIDENKREIASEGMVIEITAEMVEGTTHAINEMLKGQPKEIKRFHIDMYCDVLKKSLERFIL